jgi:hypothetical protein
VTNAVLEKADTTSVKVIIPITISLFSNDIVDAIATDFDKHFHSG